jgi:hypothetical protein
MTQPPAGAVALRAAGARRTIRSRVVDISKLLAVALVAVGVEGCTHFGGVIASHPGLAEALSRLAAAERGQDWSTMYGMLSPDFERGETLVQFADNMDAYARRRSLISWRMTSTATDGKGFPTSNWVYVEGCGCYQADGQYQAWVTSTIAVPRENGWRFDGIAIASVVDGPALRCAARQVPEGPCNAKQRAPSRKK